MPPDSRLPEQESPQLHIAEAGRARAETTRTITVGLVPSPGLPEEIAIDIRDDLAHALVQRIDDAAAWVIRIMADPITGSDIETPELLKEMDHLAQTDNWDYTIALTDLPVRREGRIILAGVSTDSRAGWLSIPALGPFRLRGKVRRTIVELMDDVHRSETDDDPGVDEALAIRSVSSDAGDEIDKRYVSSGRLAPLRLLGGMVYANEPWTIVPSFRTTAVTAVATGSYGLIFATMWELGEHSSPIRLIILMLLAISVLSAWIIVAHDLWQAHRGASSQFLTSLYNTTTVVTISVGVVVAYVLIYLVLLVESIVFMPPSLLESRLQLPIDGFNYATAAWVTASIATLAGALGAGLEDTERVRRATFSWRMQRRFEEYEAARERASDDEGEGDDQ